MTKVDRTAAGWAIFRPETFCIHHRVLAAGMPEHLNAAILIF
jgi:hypothetical protein